ncbi:MAG: hypothetical protein WCK58_07395, partial [Chloroflexota bacterium]
MVDLGRRVTLARRLRRRPVVLLATALLVLATTGVAVAVTAWAPGPNGVINGCRNASTGVLRLLSGTATACKAGEQRVSWERSGNLRSGRTAPAAGLGIAGDFYLDTLALRLYGPKAAAGWGGGAPLAGGAGKDGNTVLSGTGDPGAGTGADGDFYLATDTMTMWGPKAAGAWPGSGTGLVSGAAGPQGRSILGGSAPAGGTGKDGDYFIAEQFYGPWTIYGPKSGGAWPGSGASLKGPQGSPGPTGDPGLAGIDGIGATRSPFGMAGTVAPCQPSGLAIGTDGLGLAACLRTTTGDTLIAHCVDITCSGANLGGYLAVSGVSWPVVSATTPGEVVIGADGLGLVPVIDSQVKHVLVVHCADVRCTSSTVATV